MSTASPPRYGRVTRASIARFTAECFERDAAPPLGLLVAVEDCPETIFAVVAGVLTEGIDPTRRLTSRGEPDHDLERVLADNPHVPALLSTSFDAVVVGYADAGQIRQYLPSAPAPILARVRACSDVESAAFMQSFDFLGVIAEGGAFADDVIAATLRTASLGRVDGRAFLVQAGKALTRLLGDDPTRLHALLRRLQP